MIEDNPQIIDQTLQRVQQGFKTHKTKDLLYRKKQLLNLLQGIKDLEQEFHQALNKDQAASQFHSEQFSINPTISSLKHTLNNFEKWAKPRSEDTSMLVGPGTSYVIPEPYGIALVISAWNYPIFTALPPVIEAIAAGNGIILKPSEMSPHTSNVLKKLFDKYLDPECYQVIEGGFKVATEITQKPFDLIIFTGSPEKGKIVAKAAAENLIPCILELGGKSPTIVDSDCNLENALLRIAQGKFLNSGQTCVGCDYVLCHESIVKEFTHKMTEKVKEFYGEDAQKSDALIKIVNENHTKRIASMITEDHGGKVEIGGKFEIENRFIYPTIISNPKLDSKVMTEEIFGPILPIIPFKNIPEVIDFINERPKPLALYYFGSKNKDRLIRETSSGAFCQNEALFHTVNNSIPFGGVGNSGMGSYHGLYGFNNCSHLKPVLEKFALNIYPYSSRYPPYTNLRKQTLGTLFNYMDVSQSRVFKGLGLITVLGIGYGCYSKNYIKPAIDTIRPYIDSTMNKLSKL